MCRKGVLAQVTAGSLTGLFGSQAKRAAAHFIKEETAQFVATDAHGPGWRLEAGSEAARLLEAKAQLLMDKHPATVINGAALEAAACREIASARPWRFSFTGRKR
jgi:protein-tyrosine phosphatase